MQNAPPALLEGLSDDQRDAALAAFEQIQVDSGAVLIAEYDTTDCMYLLESGQVLVLRDGKEVAAIGPGAVLGEIGLFTAAVRTASVETRVPSVLRRLSRPAYERLRDAGNVVAFRIERRAAQQLATRLRQQVASVQAAAYSTDRLLVPVAPEPATGVTAPLSSAAHTALLGSATSFSGEPLRRLRRITPGAVVRVFADDEIITDPDGDADTLHLLLGGQVDCLTDRPGGSRREGMVRVARVTAGHLFDICPTIDGLDRPMLYVAEAEATVLSLSGSTARELYAADSIAGSVLRQALVGSLFARLSDASATLKAAYEAAVEAAGAGDPDTPELPPVDPAEAKPSIVREDLFGADVWDTWFDGEER